jgi:hypothetical protein
MSSTRDDLLWWLTLHHGFTLEVPFKGLSGKRRFRWDAAREDLMIAVEYQGQGIGHNIAPNQASDHEKISEGTLCGWLVIVVDASSVNNGKAFDYITQALEVRRGQEEANASGDPEVLGTERAEPQPRGQ